MHKKMLLRQQSKSGTSIIELCVLLLFAIPIFLIVFDCAMLIVGVQFNDKICREAARLAATSEPRLAESRANSVVSDANNNKNDIISSLNLVSVENTSNAADIKAARLNGGSVTGTVTVTTAVTVKSLAAHWFFPGHHYLTFQCKQSFPYTYVFPSSIQKNE